MIALDKARAALAMYTGGGKWDDCPPVLAEGLRGLLEAYDDEHRQRMVLTDAVLNAVSISTDYKREAARQRKAFDEVRARIGQEDVPIHVAADIEQIICETAGYFE